MRRLSAVAAAAVIATGCGRGGSPTCASAAHHLVDLMAGEASESERLAIEHKREILEQDATAQCTATSQGPQALACAVAAKSTREFAVCVQSHGSAASAAETGTAAPAALTCKEVITHAVQLMVETKRGTAEGRSLIDSNEAAILEEATATCEGMKPTQDDLRCAMNAATNDEQGRCRLFTETADLPYQPPPPGTSSCKDVGRRYVYVMSERDHDQKPPLLARAFVRAAMRDQADQIESDCSREHWSSAKRDCVMSASEMGAVLQCQMND